MGNIQNADDGKASVRTTARAAYVDKKQEAVEICGGE
jgi:hypothetical protein